MLPEKFKERMKALLGNEYEAFEKALTEQTAKKGFRINSLKCNPKEAEAGFDFPHAPLNYVKNGYLLGEDYRGIGNTPEHASGQIYVQDPGAMASAAVLDVHPGMKIADLCAAPGGKTTQLAAELLGTGAILSNEYVPKRAKILVGNIERMGIKNAVVTSLDTAEIAKLYENTFDIVVADAPCSGEGMFRKDVPAIEEWSEENVRICRERQRTILNNAAKILKVGGQLLYSTCTYSLEENEMTVDSFLKEHPEFSLVSVNEAVRKATSDGVCFEGAFNKDLYKCRRFYPHISDGEGQFIALMIKTEGESVKPKTKNTEIPPTRDELRIIESFFKDNLSEMPDAKIVKYGNNLTLVSHDLPLPPRGVFSSGVLIGEIRGKLLFPSHQFFSAYGNLFKRRANLTRDEAERYMRGEEIPNDTLPSGFLAVTYNGAVLGGGKKSDGKIKNHYPKGLRTK